MKPIVINHSTRFKNIHLKKKEKEKEKEMMTCYHCLMPRSLMFPIFFCRYQEYLTVLSRVYLLWIKLYTYNAIAYVKF